MYFQSAAGFAKKCLEKNFHVGIVMMPPGPGSQPTSSEFFGREKFRREIRRPAAVAVAGESKKNSGGDSERHEKPFCGTGRKLFLEMFLQFKREPIR